MSAHKPELMSALLDGELKGLRRMLALRHARSCPLCAAEYRNLRHVRKMLKANPVTMEMSDSPEYFWSKVKREIETRGDVQVKLPAPKLEILDWLMQHQTALVTAAATLVVGVAALWALQQSKPAATSVATLHQEESPATVLVVQTSLERHLEAEGAVVQSFAKVEKVSTAIPNTVATALDSDEADVTVIWVSGLPWTSDITEMKTEYANLDT